MNYRMILYLLGDVLLLLGGFLLAVLIYKAFDIRLDIARAKVVYFIHLTKRYV